MWQNKVPTFKPAKWLKGPHRQTIVAAFLYGKRRPLNSMLHNVQLADGDQVVLHDNQPPNWQPGDRVVLMIHGLAGCHSSPYMVRIAAKLNERAIRTFRMDLRGAGAGESLAKLPYHAGLTSDVAQAIQEIEKCCPNSPVTLVGFSMGGNLAIKLAGESGSDLPGNLDSILAASPPIDLELCSQKIPRFYDRHFLNLLLKRTKKRKKLVPDLVLPNFPRKLRRLMDLDSCYTATVSGFSSASEYYQKSSSKQFLSSIQIPALILISRDDPVIPFQSFEKLSLPENVHTIITNDGGHLGYISDANNDPDAFWLDWRVIDWINHQNEVGEKNESLSYSG